MSRRPPFVWCADCGKLAGRSWREYVLCPDCRAAGRARRERRRRAREAQVFDSLSPAVPPEPAPFDADESPDPFAGLDRPLSPADERRLDAAGDERAW